MKNADLNKLLITKMSNKTLMTMTKQHRHRERKR